MEEYEGSQEQLQHEIVKDIKGTHVEEWIYSWGSGSGSSTKDDDDDDDDVPSPMLLVAGADISKDQSYFLTGVSSEAFRNVLFPLGHLFKSSSNSKKEENFHQQQQQTTTTVREIAIQAQLPNATKRESMGICFIGKRNFSDFISDYMTPSSSNYTDNKEVFVDVDTGDVVGCAIDTTTTTTTKTKRVYTIGQGAKLSGASRK
eukprot:15329554-Ditylum_brightwellii.AAC.1